MEIQIGFFFFHSFIQSNTNRNEWNRYSFLSKMVVNSCFDWIHEWFQLESTSKSQKKHVTLYIRYFDDWIGLTSTTLNINLTKSIWFNNVYFSFWCNSNASFGIFIALFLSAKTIVNGIEERWKKLVFIAKRAFGFGDKKMAFEHYWFVFC